jgi:hypothetical protein
MSTFLLTWNPAKWTWANLAEASEQTTAANPYLDYWSCGNARRIGRGDRVFLLKQGREPRGILAPGWVRIIALLLVLLLGLHRGVSASGYSSSGQETLFDRRPALSSMPLFLRGTSQHTARKAIAWELYFFRQANRMPELAL